MKNIVETKVGEVDIIDGLSVQAIKSDIVDSIKCRKMEGNQETKVMTEAEYKASIGKKNYQWMRCALGLHKLEVIDNKPIDNIRLEVVGNIIISRCACCGKIKTKTIYTKDIR